MHLKRNAWSVLAILLLSLTARAQDNPAPQDATTTEDPAAAPVTFLLSGQIGGADRLGVVGPSTWFGPGVEIPLRKRVEFHASATYSPDHNVITHDGNGLSVEGTGVAWLTNRFGASATYSRTWLWTSAFNKDARNVAPGVVVRDNFAFPSRSYISYLLPTGCVWATPSNPCLMQSSRDQGLQFTRESLISKHSRFAINAQFIHFCDRSNPNAPSIPRACHYAPTIYLEMKLELPGRRIDTPF